MANERGRLALLRESPSGCCPSEATAGGQSGLGRFVRASVSLLFFAVVVAHLEGCSRKTEASEDVRGPRSSSSDKGAPPVWMFHPLTKAETTDEVAWGSDSVEVDRAGSRWLRRAGKPPEVSAFGAPEALAAVLSSPSKTSAGGRKLSAVGESGAVYVAEGPLSPFIEVRTPPTRFVKTTRAGSTLLSISQDGSFHRSDNVGDSWSLVSAEHFFVDLAVSESGALLSYSVPEQWHASDDQGRSLKIVDLPTQAPSRMGRSLSGEIFMEGLYQTSVYRSNRFERIGKEELRRLTRSKKDADYDLPRFPRASDVLAQRGLLVGSDYVGLRATSASGWKLERGGLNAKVEQFKVNGLSGCASYLFAASAGRSAVLCYDASDAPSGEISPRVRVYRSSKLGEDYKPVSKVFRGQPSQLGVALSHSGELAIVGLCPQPEKGCAPAGVTVLPIDDKLSENYKLPKSDARPKNQDVERVHVPGVPVPSALSFDEAGNLWLAGRRNKDGHIILYRASPGGKPGVIFDATREARFPSIPAEETKPQLLVAPGKDALLSLVLHVSGRGYVAMWDGGGRLISFGATPASVTALHGAGRLIAALKPEEGILWESTTGGLSWTRHRLPRDICSVAQSKCNPSLACSEAGCLVGEELVRLGWGEDHSQSAPSLPHDVSNGGPQGRLPGFECDVTPDDWTDLEGIVGVPRAADVAMGDAAWAQALQYPEKAALTAISAAFGSKEIHREKLLLPVADASDYAFFVIPQVEGVAAVRYRMPPRASAPGWNSTSRFSAEVAWDSRIASVYGAATIDHPAVSRMMDPFSSHGLLQSGQPGLVSVAGEGLYLRLGPRSEKAPTYFVVGRGKNATIEELGEVEWPNQSSELSGWLHDPLLRASSRHEHVRIDGEHAALMMFAGSRVIAIAEGLETTGKVRSFRPYLLGLLGSDLFDRAQDVNIAYQGDKVGFVSSQIDLSSTNHRASFVRLDSGRGLSAPIPVPLQQDVGREVAACSAVERRESPRVVAPLTLGLSRPVTVEGVEADALDLLTAAAVLFGTKEKPCVAAFEGQDEHRRTLLGHHYSVLVFPGRGAWSWLFRTTRDPSGNHATAARPLQCRPEGTAEGQ